MSSSGWPDQGSGPSDRAHGVVEAHLESFPQIPSFAYGFASNVLVEVFIRVKFGYAE